MLRRSSKFQCEKKAWFQTVKLIKEKRITRMGVTPVCRLFGVSRQAYYQKGYYLSQVEQMERIVFELVAIVRRELPGLGLNKLYKYLYRPFKTNNIKMDRDKLNTLLRKYNLLT